MKDRALKEGRADDANEATIRRRFEVYDARDGALCWPIIRKGCGLTWTRCRRRLKWRTTS